VPDRFFETQVLKNDAVQGKWLSLSPHERRAICFKFLQIAVGPELRSRIQWLPDQICNGRRLQRFLMDMGFGEFAFAISERPSSMVLIDFYLDVELLRAELECPPWHH
jgi:hypothetical protein